ncbi:MAG: class I SAM-dependent methyltransferase [Bacteroidales bacterium]|nr:class I SAM-dependent methyltransferase [Bacteroidales bacterium]
MNKINKLITAIKLILKKPHLLNLIVENQDLYKEKIIKKYNLKCGFPQIKIEAIFPEFNESVSPYAFLDGSSLPIDLALLRALAKKYKVEDYLEIGTWRGESAANVAPHVRNCVSLNLSDEELIKMGQTQAYIDSHRFFSKKISNVKHIAAHSHSFEFESLGTRFDMVFVDGDHHYESVKKDTQTAFNIIKKDDSIIVWHDYAASPETVRYDVMLGILDGSPPEKRKRIFHISNTLCAVYLTEDFSSSFLTPYAKPDKYFEMEIKIKSV